MVKGFFGRLDTTITCNNRPAQDTTTLAAQSHSRHVLSCSMRVLEAFKCCRLISDLLIDPDTGKVLTDGVEYRQGRKVIH
jgi:hypothetical protein